MTIVTFYQQPSSPHTSAWTPLHWSHVVTRCSEHAVDMSGNGNTFPLLTYDPSDDTKGRLKLYEWDHDYSFWRSFALGVVMLGNITFPSAVALSHDGSTMAIATSNGDDFKSFLDVYQLQTALDY